MAGSMDSACCDMEGVAAAVIYGVARLFESGHPPPGTVYVVSFIAEEMMEGRRSRTRLTGASPTSRCTGEPTDLPWPSPEGARQNRGRRDRRCLFTPGIRSRCHAVELMAQFVHVGGGDPAIQRIRLGATGDVHRHPFRALPQRVDGATACAGPVDCRFVLMKPGNADRDAGRASICLE